MEKRIEILKKFFTISVASFEMQHTISKAFEYKGTISYMHLLHLEALEEINKEKPNLDIIDNFLDAIKQEVDKNNRPKNKNYE